MSALKYNIKYGLTVTKLSCLEFVYTSMAYNNKYIPKHEFNFVKKMFSFFKERAKLNLDAIKICQIGDFNLACNKCIEINEHDNKLLEMLDELSCDLKNIGDNTFMDLNNSIKEIKDYGEPLKCTDPLNELKHWCEY